MYPSRDSGNAYSQQSYSSQSGYAQKLGTPYSGSSVVGSEGGSQLSLGSQHSLIRDAIQDTDLGGYRGHSSSTGHYGGQYVTPYVPVSLTGSHQAVNAKGAGQSSLENRGGFASTLSDSPKYRPTDYLSTSSHAYSRKSDTLYSERISEFPSFERRQYSERQGAYIGRDLQTKPSARFSNSSSFSQQNQLDMYDRIDQTTSIRREQLLKAQSLQSSSLDGSLRQNEYLAARTAANRHPHMDLASYGGRIDADPRSSLLGNSPYRGAETTSLLGAAPRRNVDNLLYAQGSSNPGYGVSLPPGRDYSSGRHLYGIESDFSTALLPRSGHPRAEECKDDRAVYLLEFELREEERRRERSREREREKAKERERDRERERERECERERERERERARDLQRLAERREKERERERKHVSEARRDRTPLRASKDRRASSLSKDMRPLRRDTPRHEATHRRHSPLKQIRREYVCKVYSSSLVARERDYLSIDKRYPRLFVSPELAKVVVHWPKENVKLSLHTAVSFEPDIVVADGSPEIKSSFPEIHIEGRQSERHQETVWNAKVILMSGLSRSALETLSSDKSFDDHVPHICNILKFAVLKRDRALMAIGGPCGSVNGNEPSVDDSVLIQAALRYTKDLTQIDLHKCQQWNRFLEIHYDRIGKDGLFSHKEVTVLFVPDLSDCLPSFEKWKEQWMALKKAVSQREHGKSTKTEEKSGDKIEGSKDDDPCSSKDIMNADTSERSKDSGSSAVTGKDGINEKHSVLKESPSEEKFDANDKKGTDNRHEVGKVIEDKETSDAETSNVAKPVKKKIVQSDAPTSNVAMPAKKKIVRKIVKQKASDKKAAVSSDEQVNEKPADTTAEKEKIESEDATVLSEEQLGGSSEVKTFVRKKVVKKVAVAKKSQQQVVPAEVKDQMEVEGNEGELSGIVDVNAAVLKRKNIKKVPKKKSGSSEAASNSLDKDGEQNVSNVKNSGKEASNVEKKNVEVDKQGQNLKPVQELQPAAPDKKDSSNGSDKAETEGNSKNIGQKDANSEKNLQREKLNVDQDKRDTTLGESTRKSDEDLKEKRRLEEPPRPGFVLSTKGSKDHKVHAMSVSLESLLDYSDKDIEESNCEISLFAESLYEMLQYQMGCRVLEFLRKLRNRFIRKKNLQKRKREETDGGKVKKSPKLMKTSEIPTSEATIKLSTDKTAEGDDIAADPSVHNKNVDDKSISAEDTQPGNKTAEENDGASADLLWDQENETDASNPDHVDDMQRVDMLRGEDEDPDDDPKEDPEKNEEAEDMASQPDAPREEKTDNAGSVLVIGDQAVSTGPEPVVAMQDTITVESKPNGDAPISDKKDEKMETKTKQSVLKKEDKEVMQAFHFFDRNRAGYIRVEDMRLIIHSLGKFISHRDVKELVQTALLESNIGRDDRIFYSKLVRRMLND